MRIIITEEQKKKLFIPRNIDKRYSDWNNDQPSITIDGQLFKLNQYDPNGNKIGLWLNNTDSIESNYNKTKEFMSNIFNNLTINGDYYLYGNEPVMKQVLKYGDIWVDYYKIWSVLLDQYSLSYDEIKDLIKIWMEMEYNKGSLTPYLLDQELSLGWEWNTIRGH